MSISRALWTCSDPADLLGACTESWELIILAKGRGRLNVNVELDNIIPALDSMLDSTDSDGFTQKVLCIYCMGTQRQVKAQTNQYSLPLISYSWFIITTVNITPWRTHLTMMLYVEDPLYTWLGWNCFGPELQQIISIWSPTYTHPGSHGWTLHCFYFECKLSFIILLALVPWKPWSSHQEIKIHIVQCHVNLFTIFHPWKHPVLTSPLTLMVSDSEYGIPKHLFQRECALSTLDATNRMEIQMQSVVKWQTSRQ